MSEPGIKRFSDWNELYNNEVENLPWYYEALDNDLEEEISMLGIGAGRFLDLGTGPGTQALQLSKMGFSITGTDVSERAIKRARQLSNKINFLVDNILETKLNEESFDFIFDRGCFHVLAPEKRTDYVKTVHKILAKDGFLFLKCFSIAEPMTEGPFKFSADDISSLFTRYFIISKIKETVYQGTLETLPKALFVVMKKRY
ncbi:MAG: class I SAM-dependent methyltransferase [Thermoproteota archaeon]|nr:class I SAM-dependent methyltransferase [Thermoproteota archaeon]